MRDRFRFSYFLLTKMEMAGGGIDVYLFSSYFRMFTNGFTW